MSKKHLNGAVTTELLNPTRGDGQKIHANNGKGKPLCGGRDSGKPWGMTKHYVTCGKCNGMTRGVTRNFVRDPFAKPENPVVSVAVLQPPVEDAIPVSAVPVSPAPAGPGATVVDAELVEESFQEIVRNEQTSREIVHAAAAAQSGGEDVVEEQSWEFELSFGGKSITFPAHTGSYEEAIHKALAQVDIIARQTRTVMRTGLAALNS